MGILDILKIIFVYPLLNLLVLLYVGFERFSFPGPLGWAILSLTFLFKAATQPFFKKQMQQAKKMQELAPQLKRLEKKYKNNKLKLQEEQMKLYQKAGVNPAAGCLVFLIQAPFLYALYTAFLTFLRVNTGNGQVLEEINRALYFKFLQVSSIDPNFFGFNLTISPAEAVRQMGSSAWYYYLVPVITGILQYYFSARTMPSMTDADKQKDKDKKAEKDSSEDFAKIMQMQSKFIFPFFIGWISFSFPVGLALYWNVFSLLSILQTRKIAS